MSDTVISYPIPAYQNVSIQAGYYQPSRFVISAITLGQTTLVTTSIANNYIIGNLVRLIIPPNCGCRGLNEAEGYVIAIPSATQVELAIYSANENQFIAATGIVSPQILGIGDVNSGAINTGRTNNTTYINGSFINISPL